MQGFTPPDWIASRIENCGAILPGETSVGMAIAHLQQQSGDILWVSQSSSPEGYVLQGYVTASHLLAAISQPVPAGFNPLDQRLETLIQTAAELPLKLLYDRDYLALVAALQQGDAPVFLLLDGQQIIQGQISRSALQSALLEQCGPKPQSAAHPALAPESAGVAQPDLRAALNQLNQALVALETQNQAEAKLQHRIDFEALLTQISTHFLNLHEGQIDDALQLALGRTASFTDCDRACIFQYNGDGSEAHCSHEWNRADLIPFNKPLCSILRQTFPWSLAQMQRQQIIHVPRVSELPPEADPERQAATQLQAQSYVVVPLSFQGEPLGWLAFYSVHQPKTWLPADLQQLETLGSIIAGVLTRQRADKALQESEAKFEQLADNLQQVFFIYQVEPYQLLYISPAYETIWGLSCAKLYADPNDWYATVHPDDYGHIKAGMARRLTEGRSIDLEYRIIRPDGCERWIHSRSFPLLDEAGQVYRLAGIAEDVSDRHRYEEALARSEEKFFKAFRFNPMPMAITLLEERRYLDVNNAFCQHSGFNRDELLGHSLGELNMIVEPAQCAIIHQALIAQGSFQNQELHLRCRNGKISILQSSGILMEVNGQRHVLSISHDITHQRQQETQRQQTEQALRQATRAAEAANQAKGEFLAMLSHEIRTPLNAILSMSNLLLEEGLAPQQQQQMKILRSGGQELLATLDEVLDFSRLNTSQFDLEVAPFDLPPCLQEVMELFLPQAQDKGLTLRLEIDPQLSTAMVGDSKRLKQILNNLISNAIKFTSVGQVCLTVRPSEWGEAALLFCIWDQGIGINQRGLDQLFQPFSQANNTIAQRYGGTGLGLSICDRLLRRMGGTIWVESGGNIGGSPPADWAMRQTKPNSSQADRNPTNLGQTALNQTDPSQADPSQPAPPDLPPSEAPGCGSHFYFTLPRVLLAEATQPRQSAVPSGAMEQATRLEFPPPAPAPILPPVQTKILLVEDVRLNQQVAQLLLQRLGYEADLADSGEAAIAALGQQSYAVVFLDLYLPQLDGYQIYEQLQAHPRRPWVIAMTAAVDGQSRDRCLALGMDDFIPKPVGEADLAQALKRFWQARQTPQETGASLASAQTQTLALAPALTGLTDPGPSSPTEPGMEGDRPDKTLEPATLRGIQQICSGDDFQNLIATYQDDASQQLQAMGQAMAQQDGMALFELAHSLGPASASLGGERLAQLCSNLEQQLRSQGFCRQDEEQVALLPSILGPSVLDPNVVDPSAGANSRIDFNHPANCADQAVALEELNLYQSLCEIEAEYGRFIQAMDQANSSKLNPREKPQSPLAAPSEA